MIRYESGNLLRADAEVLVNTVNCVGVMGKGIALQFKQAYPANFREYEIACRAGEVQLGRVFVHEVGGFTNPRYIFNFPTKKHWKGHSKLEDIAAGLVDMIQQVRRFDVKSIAIPPLGCGNGGLEWSVVRPMIISALEELSNVDIIVYEPAGAPAVETLPVRTKKPSLTKTRALLVKLLEYYGLPGYHLTLLEVQKLAYLLQSAGEPLKLNFIKNKYGPYAEALNHVLQRLEGHYIRGYGDRSTGAEIILLPTAGQEAGHLLSGDAESLQRLARVRELIEGFETPYGMELIASVHWVVSEDFAARTSPSHATERLQSWSRRKKNKFPPQHIEIVWRRLEASGWLA
jgi:O-acetyl-ADP-ribose deacetylase (regulator of RNase III)